MKDQFVTYEIAKKLKGLGFDEPCLRYFEYDVLRSSHEDHLESQEKVNYILGGILAPLWQQATKWLRKVHKLEISIDLDLIGCYFTTIKKYPVGLLFESKDSYTTYEEALEIGLQEALKLIK